MSFNPWSNARVPAVAPQGSTPQSPVSRSSKLVMACDMAYFVDREDGTLGTWGGSTHDYYTEAVVYSPSNRLRISMSTELQIDNVGTTGYYLFLDYLQPIRGYAAGNDGYISLEVQPGVIDPASNRESGLQIVYPPSGSTAYVPDGYESDSAAPFYYARLKNLNSAKLLGPNSYTAPTNVFRRTDDGTATLDRLTVKLVVTWEPTVEMSESELKQLFNACRIVCPVGYRQQPGNTVSPPDFKQAFGGGYFYLI